MSIVNRPSIGTGVCTVRPRQVELESGYTNTTTTGAGGGTSSVYPQALLRFGSGDPRFDLELGLPSAARSTVGGATVTGTTDINIGARYELGYTTKALWGVDALVTLPTGASAFTAGRTQYSASFNSAYAINAEFSLSSTLAANEFAGPNAGGVTQPYFAFAPTLALTAAVPGGPSQFTAEYAYFSAAGPGLGGKSWFDFIYARDIGAHTQLDIEYGVSPTSIASQTQHYVGAGISLMP